MTAKYRHSLSSVPHTHYTDLYKQVAQTDCGLHEACAVRDSYITLCVAQRTESSINNRLQSLFERPLSSWMVTPGTPVIAARNNLLGAGFGTPDRELSRVGSVAGGSLAGGATPKHQRSRTGSITASVSSTHSGSSSGHSRSSRRQSRRGSETWETVAPQGKGFDAVELAALELRPVFSTGAVEAVEAFKANSSERDFVKDRILYHVWEHSQQARMLVEGFRRVWQTIFELRSDIIRAPFASLFTVEGLFVTAMPFIPLLQDRPLEPTPPMVTHLLQRLKIGLRNHSKQGLSAYVGRDSRIYTLTIENLFPHQFDATLDLATGGVRRNLVRTEMIKTIPQPYPEDFANHVRQTGIPLVADLLLKDISVLPSANAESIVGSRLISTRMHEVGVNMRFVFVLHKYLEKAGASASDATQWNLLLRGAILMEIVLRAARHLYRAECVARPVGGHGVDALNRFCLSVASMDASLWNQGIIPIARKRFDVPLRVELQVNGTKLAALLAESVGGVVDQQEVRVTELVPVFCGDTLFRPPLPQRLWIDEEQSKAVTEWEQTLTDVVKEVKTHNLVWQVEFQRHLVMAAMMGWLHSKPILGQFCQFLLKGVSSAGGTANPQAVAGMMVATCCMDALKVTTAFKEQTWKLTNELGLQGFDMMYISHRLIVSAYTQFKGQADFCFQALQSRKQIPHIAKLATESFYRQQHQLALCCFRHFSRLPGGMKRFIGVVEEANRSSLAASKAGGQQEIRTDLDILTCEKFADIELDTSSIKVANDVVVASQLYQCVFRLSKECLGLEHDVSKTIIRGFLDHMSVHSRDLDDDVVALLLEAGLGGIIVARRLEPEEAEARKALEAGLELELIDMEVDVACTSVDNEYTMEVVGPFTSWAAELRQFHDQQERVVEEEDITRGGFCVQHHQDTMAEKMEFAVDIAEPGLRMSLDAMEQLQRCAVDHEYSVWCMHDHEGRVRLADLVFEYSRAAGEGDEAAAFSGIAVEFADEVAALEHGDRLHSAECEETSGRNTLQDEEATSWMTIDEQRHRDAYFIGAAIEATCMCEAMAACGEFIGEEAGDWALIMQDAAIVIVQQCEAVERNSAVHQREAELHSFSVDELVARETAIRQQCEAEESTAQVTIESEMAVSGRLVKLQLEMLATEQHEAELRWGIHVGATTIASLHSTELQGGVVRWTTVGEEDRAFWALAGLDEILREQIDTHAALVEECQREFIIMTAVASLNSCEAQQRAEWMQCAAEVDEAYLVISESFSRGFIEARWEAALRMAAKDEAAQREAVLHVARLQTALVAVLEDETRSRAVHGDEWLCTVYSCIVDFTQAVETIQRQCIVVEDVDERCMSLVPYIVDAREATQRRSILLAWWEGVTTIRLELDLRSVEHEHDVVTVATDSDEWYQRYCLYLNQVVDEEAVIRGTELSAEEIRAWMPIDAGVGLLNHEGIERRARRAVVSEILGDFFGIQRDVFVKAERIGRFVEVSSPTRVEAEAWEALLDLHEVVAAEDEERSSAVVEEHNERASLADFMQLHLVEVEEAALRTSTIGADYNCGTREHMHSMEELVRHGVGCVEYGVESISLVSLQEAAVRGVHEMGWMLFMRDLDDQLGIAHYEDDERFDRSDIEAEAEEVIEDTAVEWLGIIEGQRLEEERAREALIYAQAVERDLFAETEKDERGESVEVYLEWLEETRWRYISGRLEIEEAGGRAPLVLEWEKGFPRPPLSDKYVARYILECLGDIYHASVDTRSSIVSDCFAFYSVEVARFDEYYNIVTAQYTQMIAARNRDAERDLRYAQIAVPHLDTLNSLSEDYIGAKMREARQFDGFLREDHQRRSLAITADIILRGEGGTSSVHKATTLPEFSGIQQVESVGRSSMLANDSTTPLRTGASYTSPSPSGVLPLRARASRVHKQGSISHGTVVPASSRSLYYSQVQRKPFRVETSTISRGVPRELPPIVSSPRYSRQQTPPTKQRRSDAIAELMCVVVPLDDGPGAIDGTGARNGSLPRKHIGQPPPVFSSPDDVNKSRSSPSPKNVATYTWSKTRMLPPEASKSPKNGSPAVLPPVKHTPRYLRDHVSAKQRVEKRLEQDYLGP